MAPSAFEPCALCGGHGGRLRPGFKQRVVPEKAFADGEAAGLQRRRQRKRHTQKFTHSRPLRFGKDGKRIGTSPDHDNAVGDRDKTPAHDMAGMVREGSW